MKKTNFDKYLDKQMEDPDFAERFKDAGEAWDVALQITQLRQKAGLSQKDLARKLHTSQQQISRLESPNYEGHSLSMLRRIGKALDATIRVVFEPAPTLRHSVAYKKRTAIKSRSRSAGHKSKTITMYEMTLKNES